MNDLDTVLRWARSYLNGCPERETAYGFDKIYPFTTENISDYLDLFELEDKTLLTVGSSGDQIINASLNGCHDITLLDINPYSKYYYYLKVASIITLPKEKFLEFLCSADYPPKNLGYNEKSLHLEIFEQISDVLKQIDYNSYLFWNSLLKEYKPSKVRYYLFSPDEYSTHVKTRCNRYLQSPELYDKVKKNLLKTKVNFINSNIFDIELYDSIKKFDNIWLSNIGTYLDYDEIYKMTDIFTKILNENGNFMISYLYLVQDINNEAENYKPIYYLDDIFDLLQDFNPQMEMFTSINGIKYDNDQLKDAVLIYKK